MQRIFKYGKIQSNILTPDKQMNILIHGTSSEFIYRSYKLIKMIQFLAYRVQVS